MATKSNTDRDGDDSTRKEDPEEVAAREAGEQAPVIVEADEEVIRASEEAEKEANTNEGGEEIDPAVHQPHIVTAKER
jgi:hypothetical protein